MRKVVSILVASMALAGISQAQAGKEYPVESFDFAWEQETDQWSYVDTGNKCGWATVSAGSLCSEKLMLAMYTRHNPASPGGYLRHGFMHTVPNGEYGHALALTYTSGEVVVDDTTNEVEYQGTPILSHREFEARRFNLNVNDFGLDEMLGEPQLYLQPHSGDMATMDMFPDANRFNVYIWYPASEQRHWQFKKGESRAPKKTLSWYPFIDSARKGHYYHHTTNRAYGSWVKVQFDGKPTHANHGGQQAYGAYSEGGLVTPGNGRDYFARMASFSLRFHEMGGTASPYTLQTDRWTYEYVPKQNEETIANVGVGFDPERLEFDISFEDKYRCYSCDSKYQVKYSFTPFSQAGFEASDNLVEIKNYFVEDNQEPHVLVKPNAYYNQVWGKMILPREAVSRYLSGETIYFAVQDISERSIDTQAIDHELVQTDAGAREKWKLIKTINYDYMPVPSGPSITVPKKVATLYSYVNVAVGHKDISDIHETKPEDGWSDVRDTSPSASTLVGAVRGESSYQVDLKALDADYILSAAKRIEVQPVIDPCASGCNPPKRKLMNTALKHAAPMVALDLMWSITEISDIDLAIDDGDYLAVTVRNNGSRAKRITPHVLFHATGVSFLKNADNLHNMGVNRIYANGYETTWYYPLSTQDSPSLHELTVMLPFGNDDMEITDIKIVQ